MAVLAYTIAFCTSQWMNTGTFSLFIIILENIHPSVNQEAWQSITYAYIHVVELYLYSYVQFVVFSIEAAWLE